MTVKIWPQVALANTGLEDVARAVAVRDRLAVP
jgi:hypothetical protein